MSGERLEVYQTGLSLDPGETLRVVCPWCGGGGDGERCMSVTRDEATDLVLFRCFRGKCDKKGVCGNGVTVKGRAPIPKAVFRPWDTSTFVDIDNASGPARAKLQEWRLFGNGLAHSLGILWDTHTGRLAFPVYTREALLRGFVLRAVDKSKPKALTARISNVEPFIGWMTERFQRPDLWVVEDIPSAMRLMLAGQNAVAVLGNTPSDEALGEIHRARPETVVWAFDNDAFAQGMTSAKRYGMRGTSVVIRPPRDFKDMGESELDDYIKEVT